MREEYRDKKLLAMYDIRGIQSYIFATNDIKSIIGASNLVENIITNGLKTAIGEMEGYSSDVFLLEWENDEKVIFLSDPKILMQVLFVGGGNAYVLFRNGDICEQISRKLAKYVLEKSYSLNLAVATVPMTDNYMKDYAAINQEMRRVKAFMVPTKPVGAMPFMETDSITGYPLTSINKYDSKEKISTETKNKLSYIRSEEVPEKILDNMVTAKGDNSLLAVIHIDGNSMGNRIKKIMENKKEYADAAQTMRGISQNIRKSFHVTFDKMGEFIDTNSNLIKENRKGKLYRRIITAGDDITFICNPMVALQAAEYFIQVISQEDMYHDKALTNQNNHAQYGFSACAGIAFFNSHFPFSDAYQVAEACCSSAKSTAKKAEHRNGGKADGMIGNYIDFQLCTNIGAADLNSYRQGHYSYDGETGTMLARPYYVSSSSYRDITEIDLDTRNQNHNIEILWNNLDAFTSNVSGKGMVRSQAKDLRNAFSLGKEEVERQKTFLKSRKVQFPSSPEETWYDALEMMDLYKKEVKANEA